MKITPEIALFLDHCEIVPFKCWHWYSFRDGPRTYAVGDGSFQGTIAYRYAYTALRGPIPAGKICHHTCFNHWCVNPWHIAIVGKHHHRLLHAIERMRRRERELYGEAKAKPDTRVGAFVDAPISRHCPYIREDYSGTLSQ